MSDAFKQEKSKLGKGISYCLINSTFAAMFGFGLFTLGKNSCYTKKGVNTPVDPALIPDANNVTAWFNDTILLGFCFYLASAIVSLGFISKGGPLRIISAYFERIMRILAYCVFIAVHVMRFSHTGRVCSGDYLPEGATDEEVQGYMIATGNFFMTYIVLGWVMVPALLVTVVCWQGEKWAALALDAPK